MFSFIRELTGETLVKLGVALATIAYAALELSTSVAFSITTLAASMA